MYKLISDVIKRISDNSSIPIDTENMAYQQFLQDVKEQGIGIVEGPDIIEDSYVELRKKEYPPWVDQLDKMYHDFDGWKNDIQTIKNKYPQQIVDNLYSLDL